ncbi:flagellar biosynthetic protein FliO [Fusibacter tunisiensis]|uniref:Flagellar biogenesis protein FliO n=1 Tax=Fusibacter tunisiensis TaxID=1008308 RepID=A0ABS2MMQ0_9FIRM|nr:flagellar biosynthetic protein FliO [Fusibacter tunisiensis]MBM7560597.1 flagellar biogenesis protein FliO [Fusibacter tunisiensis]
MSLFTYALTTYNQTDDVWFTIRYIVVATLFISVLWIFSKALTKKNQMSLKGRKIRVLERTLLSNDKSLVLVELENIFYLLAVDKTGIHVVDKRDDLDPMDFQRKSTVEELSFVKQLKESIQKREKTNDNNQ